MARRSKQNRDALNAARCKKVERYWNDRAQSRVRANDRDGDLMKAEQEKAYRTARDKVRQEIDKFYRDFGSAAGMSAEEARQKLSRGELRDFKAELERKRAIIQEMMRKDPNNKALKKYDTEWMRLSKVRELTRKEALEANITAEIAQLGGKQQRSFDAHVNQVIHTGLKMNADDLKKLGDVDVKLGVGSPEQVMRAARENWQHSDFSDRIWADKDKLIQEAREVIEEGFARNKGAMDMATDLMTRMNVSHSNALRLVRTEFNHLSNQAALAEYKANGVKKYKFVAAIDNRTCSVCHELNGKVFNVAEARVGVNFPPIHPNCRSVTVPVIDWGDDDQWDYSNIELDDDELAALGLTDDDVKALDATAPKLASDAPAPSLSVQDANRAAADTQSVVRRAELAEKLENQTLALDADMHRELERLDKVNDELKRLEDLNQRMEAQGAALTETRAAIEAERLEQASLDLRERELEAAKLQARAAKIDPTVPKPDRDEIDAKTAQIEADKAKREARRAKDLSNAEIIAQATPSPFPLAQQTAEDAVAPRTAIGKLWARVKREVEGVKATFGSSVERLTDAFNSWVASRPLHDGIRMLPTLINVSMVLGPIYFSPRLTEKAKALLREWKHPGGVMPGDSGQALRQWEREYSKANKAALEAAKLEGVATLYTTKKYKEMNAFERLGKSAFSAQEAAELVRLNEALSNSIRQTKIPEKITVVRGLKADILAGKFENGIYTEPGFTSTSLSEAQARNFAGNKRTATMLYIDIPAGAHALYLESMTDKPYQYEILLDKGSKFQYLGKGNLPDGTKFYHVELMTDD